MIKRQNPISFHIVEKQNNQRNLITWTYPTVTDEIKTYIVTRCLCVGSAPGDLFFYLRKNNHWIYIKQFTNANKRASALVVITEDLVPTKYKVLCDILAKKYIKTNNPVELVKLYLNLITYGSVCYQENGTETVLNLKNYIAETNVKDLIAKFGLEIILIYNAILLKRRILVYHHDVEKLQMKLLAVTSLVPIRNPNEYLQPLIESIHELKGTSFYLAGTTEEYSLNNERYYDLYVNLVTREIRTSKEAKDVFAMTKIHKDLAYFLVQLSESDLNEKKVIDEIKIKLNDILKQLNSIATRTMDNNKKIISVSDLKSKKLNPALETFLVNLAIAENMLL